MAGRTAVLWSILALLGSLEVLWANSGTLFIRSQPDVELVWEGVSLGMTDETGLLVIEDIPLGTFPITLRKEGFKTLRTEIEVTRGSRTLAIDLEEIPSARPPEPVPRPRVIEPPPERVVTPPPAVSRRPATRRQEPESRPAVEAGPPRSAEVPDLESEIQGGGSASNNVTEGESRGAEDAVKQDVPDGPGDTLVATVASDTSGFPWSGILVLALVAGGGWVVWKQKSQQAGPPARPAGVQRLTQKNRPAYPDQDAELAFLGDIHRREEGLQKLVNDDGSEGERQVIEVEIEDIRLVDEELVAQAHTRKAGKEAES